MRHEKPPSINRILFCRSNAWPSQSRKIPKKNLYRIDIEMLLFMFETRTDKSLAFWSGDYLAFPVNQSMGHKM